MHKGFKFDNTYQVVIRSGETGDVLFEDNGHNDISDDFITTDGTIFGIRNSVTNSPRCFLLPDGALWSGFTFDRTNPYAPYSTSASNVGDNSADALYKSRNDSGCSLTNPYGVGNASPNKWKLFYRWSNLPINLTLRAFGLTSMDPSISQFSVGIPNNSGDPSQFPHSQTTFVPLTLVVLPSGILVRGRNPVSPGNVGTQTPDILEITYYLSILGA